MSKSDVEDDCGVSFKGKGRKFDDENDCKDLIDAIKACKKLEYLNLEGNSVGVQAAEIISKALAEHPELKRAIWKDMFTGRMKTEIPKALEYLGSGLNLAGAQLTELDLSDNAFGPIGVEGLAGLLASESCYSLKELRLNNNGLGISGGKMLAKALLQCHANSAAAGKALALKTLIAGRNRLENDGAKALSEVFQTLGTLEEISMPQNGIYHPGIAALSQALTKNPNLKILNLNDNTLTEKGATSIANVLPHLQKLKSLNLGDCLLRTGGATVLANALADQHLDLEELNLDNNEIKIAGGLAVAKAMGNKERLKELLINGNNFGESGKVLLKKELEKGSKLESLGTLSDDESECDDDDEEGQGDQESEEEDQEDSEKEDSKIEMFNNINSNNKINNQDSQLSNLLENLQVSGQDDNTDAIANLLKDTAALERLIGMDDGKINEFLENNKNPSTEFYLNSYIPFLMKISSLSNSGVDTAKSKVLEISLALYRRLFSWASQNGQIAAVNNALFVYLGLIKSEDKSFKINWDINGCVSVLKSAIDAGIIPDTTKQILTCCLERKISKS